MDYDLSRGLRALSDDAVVPAEVVPLGTVVTRVRRVRTLRTAGVTVAGAAAVVVLALAVQAAPFHAPVAPAGPTASTEATQSPSTTAPPTPTPSTTPPTPPPVEPTHPLVTLTSDGRLLLLDPGTGAVLTTLTPRFSPAGPGIEDDPVLTVAPDGTAAYVQAVTTEGALPTITRVSLPDGATEAVAEGWYPAVSPDGTTLAFLAPRTGDEPGASFGLHLRDLTTGDERYLDDSAHCECEREVTPPTWSPDGRHIALGLGFAGLVHDVDVVVVELAQAANLQDGHVLETPQVGGRLHPSHRSSQTYLPDGRLATLLVTQVTDENVTSAATESAQVQLLDPATGEATATVPVPDRLDRGRLSPSGDGFTLVLHRWDDEGYAPRGLYRWDPVGGLREIGTGFEAAAG